MKFAAVFLLVATGAYSLLTIAGCSRAGAAAKYLAPVAKEGVKKTGGGVATGTGIAAGKEAYEHATAVKEKK